eukprot:1176807-Prorocentrum_minimum.AAC.4
MSGAKNKRALPELGGSRRRRLPSAVTRLASLALQNRDSRCGTTRPDSRTPPRRTRPPRTQTRKPRRAGRSAHLSGAGGEDERGLATHVGSVRHGAAHQQRAHTVDVPFARRQAEGGQPGATLVVHARTALRHRRHQVAPAWNSQHAGRRGVSPRARRASPEPEPGGSGLPSSRRRLAH